MATGGKPAHAESLDDRKGVAQKARANRRRPDFAGIFR